MTRRKHRYDAKNAPLVAAVVMRRGLFEADLAGGLEVSRETIGNWKAAHPEFNRAVRLGRLAAWRAGLRPDLDPNVSQNSRRRAMREARKKFYGTYTDERLQEIEAELLELWQSFYGDTAPLGDAETAIFALRLKGVVPLHEYQPRPAKPPRTETHELAPGVMVTRVFR